jgi:hypothetical protein
LGWLASSAGIFKLHDSDNYCGSLMTVEDAAEILGSSTEAIKTLPITSQNGQVYVSESDIHPAWSSGRLPSVHPPRIGGVRRSFDELVLRKVIEISLPDATVDVQVPFGKRRADLRVTYRSDTRIIEFDGPTHFIATYDRPLGSPLARKAVIEAKLGAECIIWPYWIQRCSRNVLALFNPDISGLASVWSTRAMFGAFSDPDAAAIIVAITDRFNTPDCWQDFEREAVEEDFGAARHARPRQFLASKSFVVERGSRNQVLKLGPRRGSG